MIYIYKIAPLK